MSDNRSPHFKLPTERFEYKYQLDLFEYYQVRNALCWATRYDQHSLSGDSGRYFVRSLYYDTYDYQAYIEKVTGVPNRIKLRIRSYWPDRHSARFLKIEIKTRTGNLVGKFAEPISPEEYEHLLSKRAWMTKSGSVLDEFRRLILLKDLKPVLLVDYEREAFIPKECGDVRITFDHGLRFAQATEIFPSNVFFQMVLPQGVIMEIKVKESMPRWLEELARQYELKSVPNSKYAMGIERTQHAIFH